MKAECRKIANTVSWNYFYFFKLFLFNIPMYIIICIILENKNKTTSELFKNNRKSKLKKIMFAVIYYVGTYYFNRYLYDRINVLCINL